MDLTRLLFFHMDLSHLYKRSHNMPFVVRYWTNGNSRQQYEAIWLDSCNKQLFHWLGMTRVLRTVNEIHIYLFAVWVTQRVSADSMSTSDTHLSRVLDILRSLYRHIQTLEEFAENIVFREGHRAVLIEQSDTTRFRAFVRGVFVCFDKELQQIPSCNQVSSPWIKIESTCWFCWVLSHGSAESLARTANASCHITAIGIRFTVGCSTSWHAVNDSCSLLHFNF